MFTINVKMQDVSKKDVKKKTKSEESNYQKLELIFYKPGYPRVPKVLNISGLRKDWDEKKQLFKERDSDCIAKNKQIIEEKMKYQVIAEQWEAENATWSPKMLSHYFDLKQQEEERTSEENPVSVSELIDIRIEYFRNLKREKNGKMITSSSNAENYLYLKNSLIEFTKSKYNKSFSSFYFYHIDSQFLQDYIDFVIKTGIKRGNKGGLPHKLRLLRSIVTVAEKKYKYYGADSSIFVPVKKLTKEKPSETKTISYYSIGRIEKIDRSLFTKKENLHIDMFLFCYYTGGMCNIDACFLTRDSIKEDMVDYERIKVCRRAKPLLTNKAKAIIDKYKDEGYADFIFPVFTHKHDTEDKQYLRVKGFSMKVNATLRKVREILKIRDKITWNSCRGTFISKMIDSGYNPIVVSKFAGNSPEMIYKHYYKNVNQKSMLKNMNEIF